MHECYDKSSMLLYIQDSTEFFNIKLSIVASTLHTKLFNAFKINPNTIIYHESFSIFKSLTLNRKKKSKNS